MRGCTESPLILVDIPGNVGSPCSRTPFFVHAMCGRPMKGTAEKPYKCSTFIPKGSRGSRIIVPKAIADMVFKHLFRYLDPLGIQRPDLA